MHFQFCVHNIVCISLCALDTASTISLCRIFSLKSSNQNWSTSTYLVKTTISSHHCHFSNPTTPTYHPLAIPPTSTNTHIQPPRTFQATIFYQSPSTNRFTKHSLTCPAIYCSTSTHDPPSPIGKLFFVTSPWTHTTRTTHTDSQTHTPMHSHRDTHAHMNTHSIHACN